MYNIRKIVFALGILFMLQLSFSCIPCNCPGPQTFEVNYSTLRLDAWNISGLQNKIIKDTIHKDSLGLTIVVESELENIAEYPTLKGHFGFNSAVACDCDDDIYAYPDPIDYLEILVTDTQTSETINATDYFVIPVYGNREPIALSEFSDPRIRTSIEFQIELAEATAIPHSSIFTVNVYLESGTKFTDQTEQINFYE